MTHIATPVTSSNPPRQSIAVRTLWALLPLILLGGVLWLIVATDAGLSDRQLPPIETLNVSRVVLPEPGLIELRIVNDGPDPITVAQVLVDDAYWQFNMEPAGTLERLESATVSIPYPWVEGEGHAIGLVTETGVVFNVDIPMAVEAPEASRESFTQFALVGLYVGIVPVTLGLLWYPSLRHLSLRGMNFILSLTIGLLIFLVVDMWGGAQEVALGVAGSLGAPVLIPLLALLTASLLVVIGHSMKKANRGSDALPLAYRIATGIGLHNMGEGLAIGAAFAVGEVALGVFLIIGFTLHNVTEGVGIAAPLVRDRPTLAHFGALALIAGGPAVIGTWIGAFVFSPLWTTVFLAIGIGAIIQVIVEVGQLVRRSQDRQDEPMLTWTTFGGLTAGLVVMYATALLVSA